MQNQGTGMHYLRVYKMDNNNEVKLDDSIKARSLAYVKSRRSYLQNKTN